MYILPFLDAGKGPKTSTATLSNASLTEMENSVAFLEFLGVFFGVEQSWQDFMFNIFKPAFHKYLCLAFWKVLCIPKWPPDTWSWMLDNNYLKFQRLGNK